MSELLPCPFCGSDAEVAQVGSARQSTIYRCTHCSCSLETGEVFNIGQQWNEREPDRAALAQEREQCAKVADEYAEKWHGFVAAETAHDIAAAIRARGER